MAKRDSWMVLLAAGLALPSFACTGASAVRSKGPQPAPDGRILVRIVDESGTPFPGVPLVLESLETGSKRSEVTDARGRAAFRNPVPPGDYMMHIEFPGYRRRLESLVIGPGRAAEVREFAMEPLSAQILWLQG